MSDTMRREPPRTLDDALGELERAALAYARTFGRYEKARATVEEMTMDIKGLTKDELVRVAASIRLVKATVRRSLADGTAAKRIAYADYLESPGWQLTAAEARKRAEFKCQRCGAGDRPLDVHHLTYERRGEELDSDLLVVCHDCHSKEHGLERQGSERT